MKIAVLGWGSLIWNPHGLNVEDKWHTDGPVLPIEFSRISGLNKEPPKPYLSLVIDHAHGTPVQVLYAFSKEASAEDSRRDLAKREMDDQAKVRYIGIVKIAQPSESESAHAKTIRQWAVSKSIAAVVWTDVPPNFSDEMKVPFTFQAALDYLTSLSADDGARAWEYIAHAPSTTETNFRKYLRRSPQETQS